MAQTYHIITYGCQMNLHESEKLAGILEARGLILALNESDADIVVFNTCCIRENAENRVVGNLGHIKKLKEDKPSMLVAVCGCMTQQKGAAERLKKRCPFINIIFGTHNLHQFDRYLEEIQNGKKSVVAIWDEPCETNEDVPSIRGTGVNAWVNIMYGCNNYCAYCIVPYVRGRERSRSPQAIIDEIKRLLDEGYKEITLLGQNVNSYHAEDQTGKPVDFAKLIDRAASLGGKYRLRFMTSHPKDLSDDVIRTIASHPNIPEFIHLPAQSGSDRILDLMNRKYTASQYLSRIETIRKFMPNAGISGDLMVGFPTETETDFLDTLHLVEQVQYSNLYTFVYSRRKGTAADSMEGHLDEAAKVDRITRLIKAQAEVAYKVAKREVGNDFEVLCDAYFEKMGKSRGKTANGKMITFETGENMVGKFVNISVTHTRNTNLYGMIKQEKRTK